MTRAPSACVAQARRRMDGCICGGKHAGLQRGREKKRKSRGLGEPHGLPVGNLSSRRQTLLSKVREPKNLLEKTQLSGDKIGATVLVVCSVTC